MTEDPAIMEHLLMEDEFDLPPIVEPYGCNDASSGSIGRIGDSNDIGVLALRRGDAAAAALGAAAPPAALRRRARRLIVSITRIIMSISDSLDVVKCGLYESVRLFEKIMFTQLLLDVMSAQYTMNAIVLCRSPQRHHDLKQHKALELEPFLALEPPMSATDYGFCLDHDEGLSELFDFDLKLPE
ncbi:hypothetical protein MSG28_000563 [Choristoneura fumiferana]|uniref:Uncharacterized protein n=1 Tax=Choristoneura fumiferana TaxID=7141 RepID=A0ACC0K1R3_CHOFU|nr:hypothetical protein MSG28_000563 [Choristoneura fumiferana]